MCFALGAGAHIQRSGALVSPVSPANFPLALCTVPNKRAGSLLFTRQVTEFSHQMNRENIEQLGTIDDAELNSLSSPLLPADEIPSRPGRKSIQVCCPHCKNSVATLLRTEIGCCTWTASTLMLPCVLCCVPFFGPCCKDVGHYCPRCGYLIAIGRVCC